MDPNQIDNVEIVWIKEKVKPKLIKKDIWHKGYFCF